MTKACRAATSRSPGRSARLVERAWRKNLGPRLDPTQLVPRVSLAVLLMLGATSRSQTSLQEPPDFSHLSPLAMGTITGLLALNHPRVLDPKDSRPRWHGAMLL